MWLMKLPSKSWTAVIRAALLLLLLSMQSYTLAHELDQGTVHDGSSCVACSVGSNGDGAISSDYQQQVVVENVTCVATFIESAPTTEPHHYSEARAPPKTL